MPNVFPEGKRFAFTIVDDTDGSTLSAIRPLYDLLSDIGLRTTKTVWVYPSRDEFFGDTLQDRPHLDYLLALRDKGFEIGLHNVGSGSFSRDEILAGLDEFKRVFGCYPRLLANHGWNPDCLYWGSKRFSRPVGAIFRMFKDRADYSGEIENSPHFWGDRAKNVIQYVRNYTFDTIDLTKRDRWFPYHDVRKPYVNYWFSSVDARSIDQMLEIVSKRNIDQLENDGGICILYTHCAYGLVRGNRVHPELSRRLEYLARKGGYFVPASTLLDHLLTVQGATDISSARLLYLDLMWLWDHTKIALRDRIKFSRSVSTE